MSDLAEYFSDKDKIKELERQLICARRTTSRYKRLYEEVVGVKELTRGQRACVLIDELKGTDRPVRLIKLIADKCFLTPGTVNRLWYPK